MSATQPTLFDRVVVPAAVAGDEHLTIEQRFQIFHRANPHVYDRLLAKARRMHSIGFKRYSMKTLFETLRWEQDLQTTDPARRPFKLNNDFTALYSRQIMANVPELEGFFETRKRAAA